MHPLQTKAWAKFRREWGNEILETKYGNLTLHKIPILNKKIGMFIRGPKPTQKMLSDLKKIGTKNKLIFIKLEPNAPTRHSGLGPESISMNLDSRLRGNDEYSKTISLLQSNNSVPGKTLFTPTSYWIDLTKSVEDLMKSFKSKTRYNIRLANRKGVEVVEDNSDKAFNAYIKLMRETVKRQRFYAHSEKYHRLMWKHLRKADIAHLLVAKHKKQILTTWILFKWKDKLYYPYGAWSGKKQNLQPNSAMMWGAINFGKQNKLKTFDLWGREEGKGFAKFKEGFSPEVVEFLGTWDLVINKKLYYIYLILEKLRWISLRSKSKFKSPSF